MIKFNLVFKYEKIATKYCIFSKEKYTSDLQINSETQINERLKEAIDRI